MISVDPTVGIELPKLPYQLPKALSSEQAERLIATAKRLKYTYRFEAGRNAALIALMLFTGLRRQEVANLQMEHVDLSRMAISVIAGKGRKDRIVPISTRLAAIILEYLKERARLNKMCPNFFVTAQYDTPLTSNAIRLTIQRLRKAAGFYFSAHALRHTFATLMLEGGCDLYTLSRMMGHTKIATTTIYLSCSSRMMASSMELHPLN